IVPATDPGFGAIVDRCLSRDPRDRFPSTEALCDALSRVSLGALAAELPRGNPYRGLRPFEPEHRALFFGRSEQVWSIVERLRTESRGLVTGDSGVGKSSACRAGVIPVLMDGAAGDGSWRVVRMVPGRRPLQALATALAPEIGVDPVTLRGRLGEE